MERIKQAILELANTLQLPDRDDASIREYIEHNEAGIAFELLCSAIEQEKIPVSKEIFKQISEIGSEMEFDKSLWDKIKI